MAYNEAQKPLIEYENVLNALDQLPRHWFLDSAFDRMAYEDKAMPIGSGQTISQPFTVAVQSALLALKPGDKVLEIGTGSGYQAGILHLLGAEVHTIEYQPKLYHKTKKLLQEIGLGAVHLYYGDGTMGLGAEAPFDKILITAGAPHVPDVLFGQLKIGGVMVVPIGNENEQTMKKLIKQDANTAQQIDYTTFRFVPLLGKSGWRV